MWSSGLANPQVHENKYYILASCCTVLFNEHCRLYLRLCATLLYVGFHCLSLHGYLQVCRSLHIFIFVYLRILLRCFFFAAFFTWPHSACFPFVFCFCAVFLRVYFGVFLLMLILIAMIMQGVSKRALHI
jgi:hypothetical protein